MMLPAGPREAGRITGSDGIALVVVTDDRNGRRSPRAQPAMAYGPLSEDHLDADADKLGSEFLQVDPACPRCRNSMMRFRPSTYPSSR